MDPKTIAQATYEKAQEAQRIARKNVDDLNASLAEQRKAFEAAKAALDAAKPALTIIKAQLQKADADVAIARAELSKLAPVPTTNGRGSDQGKVIQAVTGILAAAGPEGLSVDDIFNRLQADGVEMAGAKPRENLGAYIPRWAKVSGSGIVSLGRGKWGGAQTEPAPQVPAFLAPTGDTVADASGSGTTVPEFLTVKDTVTEPPQDSDDQEDTSEPLALPEGFPGREALIEAGFDTQEKLSGKTHDQLRRIKGVGAQTAKLILEALEA